MERSMAQSTPKLTYDDLALFPDDGKRHELIDGEHFVTPAPHLRHPAARSGAFVVSGGLPGAHDRL